MDADCPLPGDAARQVRGLAVDEPVKGWISADEVAVTARETLDEDFMQEVASIGSPAVVWRLEGEVPAESVGRAAALGVGLFVLTLRCPSGGSSRSSPRTTGYCCSPTAQAERSWRAPAVRPRSKSWQAGSRGC